MKRLFSVTLVVFVTSQFCGSVSATDRCAAPVCAAPQAAPCTARPEAAPAQQLGSFISPLRRGAVLGESNAMGLRGGSIVLPEIRLGLPRLILPGLTQVRYDAEMELDRDSAPFVTGNLTQFEAAPYREPQSAPNPKPENSPAKDCTIPKVPCAEPYSGYRPSGTVEDQRISQLADQMEQLQSAVQQLVQLEQARVSPKIQPAGFSLNDSVVTADIPAGPESARLQLSDRATVQKASASREMTARETELTRQLVEKSEQLEAMQRMIQQIQLRQQQMLQVEESRQRTVALRSQLEARTSAAPQLPDDVSSSQNDAPQSSTSPLENSSVKSAGEVSARSVETSDSPATSEPEPKRSRFSLLNVFRRR